MVDYASIVWAHACGTNAMKTLDRMQKSGRKLSSAASAPSQQRSRRVRRAFEEWPNGTAPKPRSFGSTSARWNAAIRCLDLGCDFEDGTCLRYRKWQQLTRTYQAEAWRRSGRSSWRRGRHGCARQQSRAIPHSGPRQDLRDGSSFGLAPPRRMVESAWEGTSVMEVGCSGMAESISSRVR